MYKTEQQITNEQKMLESIAAAKGWKKASVIPEFENEFSRRVKKFLEEHDSEDKILELFDNIVEEDNGGEAL
ncbi:MAG: hypothetical protein J6Y02_09970 [Pseudobutyrivibrio sp.]|nr:hypothetical protein [Pseudobutyrivibrio sp.]